MKGERYKKYFIEEKQRVIVITDNKNAITNMLRLKAIPGFKIDRPTSDRSGIQFIYYTDNESNLKKEIDTILGTDYEMSSSSGSGLITTDERKKQQVQEYLKIRNQWFSNFSDQDINNIVYNPNKVRDKAEIFFQLLNLPQKWKDWFRSNLKQYFDQGVVESIGRRGAYYTINTTTGREATFPKELKFYIEYLVYEK